jgi:agmatinase
MEYTTSRAVEVRKTNQAYELVNFITGKCYKVSEQVVDILKDFKEKREINYLESKLLNSNFSQTEIDNLVSFLIRSEILLDSNKDQTIHVVKHTSSAFDVGFKDISKLEADNIVFLGIPFGNGNPTDNKCKDFPDDFREFSTKFLSLRGSGRNIRYRTFSKDTDYNNLQELIQNKRITDVGNIFLLNNEDNDLVSLKITEVCKSILSAGCVPVILGGDHSITYPIVKAISEKHEQFQILHFDAHFDYKNSKVLNLYLEFDHFLLNHASFINHCVKIPNLRRVTQLGIRSSIYPTSGDALIKTFWCDEIEERMEDIKRTILKDVPIYISFDVDFLDPSVAPATATPVINGASYELLCTLLKELLSNKNIIGLDIVEVNPHLDNKQQTKQLMAYIILTFINYIR